MYINGNGLFYKQVYGHIRQAHILRKTFRIPEGNRIRILTTIVRSSITIELHGLGDGRLSKGYICVFGWIFIDTRTIWTVAFLPCIC